ncbi:MULTISPECIES: D-hexose-6-phosphate mutarotase [Cryobacterium]|uniref:Putative glucose-6-phosphate 1-epimerase n=1 Tax=Cryobacterium breve TaxID=1259258 RepID=A0ABY2IU44_9MICO|nr:MULTISPECIES: D-hexose-6-phosphate mutarotase [Cryobacterium]TFC94868.1 D-hexose-6-phosphate mutarotase [Cryobacterium breve]TFC94998.1 D-hexose-6-phosphate mutarotase [Cryobacterium sp. TmT3-12]
MSSTPSAPASLPASVRIGEGTGGLTVVRVAGRGGSAEVYLHGAQVTGFRPAGGLPLLFLSAASRFEAAAAIRGGVPICFPWFGANAHDPAAPSHGFARLTEWDLVDAHESGDDVVLVFGLTDTPSTRASAWPHRFEARYTVTVGARLTLTLQVTNLEMDAVTFEEALHTYLRVTDVRVTTVSGLEGIPFVNQVTGLTEPAESTPVDFTAETDRLYLGSRGSATVEEPNGRRVTIEADRSDSTVIWNPWIAKAAAMGDIGDNEWPGMVCVETANVRRDQVRLDAGQSHTMSVMFEVSA